MCDWKTVKEEAPLHLNLNQELVRRHLERSSSLLFVFSQFHSTCPMHATIGGDVQAQLVTHLSFFADCFCSLSLRSSCAILSFPSRERQRRAPVPSRGRRRRGVYSMCLLGTSPRGKSVTGFKPRLHDFRLATLSEPGAVVTVPIQKFLRYLEVDKELGDALPLLEYHAAANVGEEEVWVPMNEFRPVGTTSTSRRGTGTGKQRNFYVWWDGQRPMTAARAQFPRSVDGRVRWAAEKVPRGVRDSLRISLRPVTLAEADKLASEAGGESLEEHVARYKPPEEDSLGDTPVGLIELPDSATGFEWIQKGGVLYTRLGAHLIALQPYHLLEYFLVIAFLTILGKLSKKQRAYWVGNLRDQLKCAAIARETKKLEARIQAELPRRRTVLCGQSATAEVCNTCVQGFDRKWTTLPFSQWFRRKDAFQSSRDRQNHSGRGLASWQLDWHCATPDISGAPLIHGHGWCARVWPRRFQSRGAHVQRRECTSPACESQWSSPAGLQGCDPQ